MKIAIIDYDVGNIKNVQTALKDVALDSVITRDPAVIAECDGIVLPGVGAFADAMRKLEEYDLVSCLKANVAQGKPLLGICLGMQLLFDQSFENGEYSGLGLIPGKIVRFDDTKVKVPHMGWNNLILNRDDPIAAGITDEDYVYFVHSYYALPDDFDDVVAYAEYDVKVPGIVRKGSVIGMQFHPEKSALVGTKLLENFKAML